VNVVLFWKTKEIEMGKSYKYDEEQDGNYREFKKFKKSREQFEMQREDQEEFINRNDKRNKHE
jgi:hypothetical protein